MNDMHAPDQIQKRLKQLGLLLVVVAIVGIGYRVHERSVLAAETRHDAIVTVRVVSASVGAKSEGLELPATVQAYVEAPIYARTSGYLKAYKVDIGAKVHKGDLLAEIDAPDVDQQLKQATADVETAAANAQIAQSTNQRWQQLLVNEAVSPQDAEEKAADARAKQALWQSAKANQARLKELVGFKNIIAPFAGTVTARNIDVGALINAGQNSAEALFKVADTHLLRVYVNVPADSASRVHVHQKAKLIIAGLADKSVDAEVTHVSDALDALTRTMQVQLEVNNADGKILVGSYATVHFDIEGSTALRVPANALIFRSQGLQLATVDAAGLVTLKSVAIGRDLGSEVEIIGGLTATDRIIINPPDSIISGIKVNAESLPTKPTKAGP